MPTVTPPSITALPAAPDPNNRATFNALAYPWSASLSPFGTQVAALGANVKANADDAATSATTATTQSGLATSNGAAQVTLATTQAGNAAASAATAATQAGTATTQANASGVSAAASEASRIAASKLNLGSKAVAPTLDNQGAALLAGATYYDTAASKWRVWSGAAWVDGLSAVAGVTSLNSLTGAVTGIATTAANTFTAAQEWATGANIASAATVNLDTATGNRVHITGTTAITAVTLTRGPRTVIFDGILTLTHNVLTNNLNAGGANIITAAGDRCVYESDGVTVYGRYTRASGAGVVAGPSGALVLLSSVNASAATTVDVETGFSATYDSYMIICDGFANSAGGEGRLQIKTGGAYDAAANYFFSSSGGSTVAAVSGMFNSSSGADTNGAYVINVFGANSSAAGKIITGNGASRRTTPGVSATLTTYNAWNNTGVIQGVRLFMATGTISGTFRLYGIAKA